MPGYNRVVLSGTLASGAEIWSCGINFGAPGSTLIQTAGDLGTWAAALGPVMTTTLGGTLGSALSSQGRLTLISTYYYPTTTANAAAVGSFVTSTSGSSTAALPLQTAVVASLRTPFAGRSNRGRFYWPLLGIPVGITGRLSGANTSALATAVATMLNSIAGAAPASSVLEPAVVSAVQDTVTSVTSVDVGDVPDTQRRRSQGLVDARTVVPV